MTETAVLRGKVRDLEQDRDALFKQFQEQKKLLGQAAVLAAAQQDEIRKLRRQVKALRDGAILDEEP